MTAAGTLRPGLTRGLRAQWRGADIDTAAASAARQLAGASNILPLTLFGGARVYPLVAWDTQALAVRLALLSGPVLDRGRLREVMLQGQVPSPLRITGFIGVGSAVRVRTELAGLRAVARTVGLFSSSQRWSPMLAAEFDAQGTAAVVAGDKGIEVRVGGDGGAPAGSDLAPGWRRLFEEQLFAWAIERECWPEA